MCGWVRGVVVVVGGMPLAPASEWGVRMFVYVSGCG